MTYTGSDTAGNRGDSQDIGLSSSDNTPRVLGARRLFQKKLPGSPGKLGKSSTKAESLSKLRGKGALA